MKYVVRVEEVYVKEIEVEADSEEEAGDIVSGGEIIMQPEDYVDESFQIIDIVKAE